MTDQEAEAFFDSLPSPAGPAIDRGPPPAFREMDPESWVRVVGYTTTHRTVLECEGDPARLGLALDAYAEALARHGYPAQRFPLGRDPAASRYAPRILAALEAMRGDATPPAIWADWLVAADRKLGKARPIPIFVAFTPGMYGKRRGWFKRERAADFARSPVLHPDDVRVRYEQHFRNQEVQSAWRDGLAGGAHVGYLAATDLTEWAWYGELRRREIAEGAVHPFDRYPRLVERHREVGRR